MINSSFLRPQKVLLAVPPTGLYIREDRCQTPIDKLKTVAPRPPVDLLYIAAVLRQAGVSCEIKDYPVQNKTQKDFEDDIRKIEPDWVVVSITTPGLEEDLQLIDSLKQKFPGVHFIAKGAHFNAYQLDRETLKQCPALSAVTRGEYEDVFRRWVEAEDPGDIPGLTFRQGEEIRKNPGTGKVEDLDTLPFPARDLINNALYCRPDTGEPQTTIVTSRGCPYYCNFCLTHLVSGKKVRLRSPRRIVDEIIECRDVYNIHNFLFRSDTFTINKKWLKELCGLLQEECPDIKWACNSRVDLFTPEVASLLKESGCWLVAFGVESGDQEMLDSVGKDATIQQAFRAMRICKKTGLMSSVYLLLGLPEETPQSFRKTLKMLKKLDPDFVEFFYTYPFPGSRLYKKLVDEGLLKKGEFPRSAYSEPAFATPHFTIHELKKQRFRLWRSFYLRPSYIMKVFRRNISRPRVLKNYILHGLAQLKAFLKKEQL